MFIYYEWIEAVLEYAPNKMIVSLTPSAFLFIEDWAAVRHLKQPHANIYQFCMKPHPLFDEKRFPFVVCLGKSFYSWINVVENRVQIFIQSGRELIPNTDAFFFLKQTYGYSLHFVEEQEGE